MRDAPGITAVERNSPQCPESLLWIPGEGRGGLRLRASSLWCRSRAAGLSARKGENSAGDSGAPFLCLPVSSTYSTSLR